MPKLYSVKSYSLPAVEFEKYMEYLSLDEAIEKLNTNFYYHFRIHPKTQYIFFGDLDNYPYPIEKFIDILHTFLNDKYNLKFDKTIDFNYTQNTEKQGSYHYSISKWNISTEQLKTVHCELIKSYPNEFIVKTNKKLTYCVDTTIYSEHWFRCPNQSKGNGNNTAIHKIITGTIRLILQPGFLFSN